MPVVPLVAASFRPSGPRAYLYLARRDKRGIRPLMVFSNKATLPPLRVTDVARLGLPDGHVRRVLALAHEHRMDYELWTETAESYDALRQSLTRRGYSSLPFSFEPAAIAGCPAGKAVGPRTMLRG